MKTKKDTYSVNTDKMQFHVQEYIEGITFEVNTAPDWFIEKSAQTLGKIHSVLKNYQNLNRSFGDEFFTVVTIDRKKDYLKGLLNSIKYAMGVGVGKGRFLYLENENVVLSE